MNTRSFVRVLLMTCWVPVVLAVLAVCFEAMTISEKGTRFVAIGKLFIEPGKAVGDGSQAGDPYGEIAIELMDGAEVRRRTLERVRGLHPELREFQVELVTTRDKNTSSVRVAAICAEQIYTKVYLNAWLDEFMAFQDESVEQSLRLRTSKAVEEVLSRERTMHLDSQALDAFQSDHDPLVLAAERERLAKAISARRGEVEDLERAAGGEDKSKAAREALSEAERKFAELTRSQTKLDQLKEKYQAQKDDYDQWKKRLEDLTAEVKLWQPRITLMERPQLAEEDAPEMVTPITVAAFVGAGAGLLLIFVISACVGFAKRGAV